MEKATFPGITCNIKCYSPHIEKDALALAVKVLLSKIRCFISFTKLSLQSRDEVKLLRSILSENGFFRATYRFLDTAVRTVMSEQDRGVVMNAQSQLTIGGECSKIQKARTILPIHCINNFRDRIIPKCF